MQDGKVGFMTLSHLDFQSNQSGLLSLSIATSSLSGSKYSSVCALYAEKEQQCLAAGVACRYTTHIVMLFLISETSLHDGGAQCADNSSGGANVDVFILWLWTFADKTGGYAVFGAVPPN